MTDTPDNDNSPSPPVPAAQLWVPQKILKLTELPVTIELEDGTTIVIRLVVGGVAKDVNNFTADGKGTYTVLQQTSLFIIDGANTVRRN